jgi:hypothetical protein
MSKDEFLCAAAGRLAAERLLEIYKEQHCLFSILVAFCLNFEV